MDMAAGGDQKLEQLRGISVKHIELGQLGEYEVKIRQLGNNVLDTNKSQKEEGSSEQRIATIGSMIGEIRNGSDHHELLVAEENEIVVGFVFISKENKIHIIKELWVGNAPGGQLRIIEELVDAARRHHSPLHVNAPTPSNDLLRFKNWPGRERTLVFEKQENQKA